MAFILSRNAKLYVSTVDQAGGGDWDAGSMTPSNTFRVEVLDGFSFPSNTTTQDVTVSEAGPTPIRGQQTFTTSIDPVDWSFSAYVRPYNDTNVEAPELILWGSMAATIYNNALTLGAAGAYAASAGSVVSFANSNVNQLQKLFLYFDLGGTWYKISNAVVDTAEFDFGLEQIGMIAWSGKADSSQEIAAPTTFTTAGYKDVPAATDSSTFLQNKLTAVEVLDKNFTPIETGVLGTSAGTAITGVTGMANDNVGDYLHITGGTGATVGWYRIDAVGGATSVTLETAPGDATGDLAWELVPAYSLAITGGNLTVTNNITFLTPESLGVINQPIDHFTGTRGVSGSMSAYLKTGGTNDTGDLYNAIATDTATVTQNFLLRFHVGGSNVADNQIDFTIENAHLVVPTINIEDAVSLNIDFTGLPHDGTVYDLEQTNELSITYRHV